MYRRLVLQWIGDTSPDPKREGNVTMKNRKRLLVFAIVVLSIFIGLYLIRSSQKPAFDVNNIPQQRTSSEETTNFVLKTSGTGIQNEVKSEDPWDIWIEEQVETGLQQMLADRAKEPNLQPLSAEGIEHRRDWIRDSLLQLLPSYKEKFDNPSDIPAVKITTKRVHPKRYEGAQTTEAILAEFADKYNATWETPEIAEKYPQDEWIQMLLDKGIRIEDERDFYWYQEPRRELIRMEKDPSWWSSGAFGIPPTDDWETYKNAYIDKTLWRHELTLNTMKSDINSTGGIFVGENQDVFLPTTPNRVYVEKHGTGATFYGGKLDRIQQFNLLFKGIVPEHYDIVFIDAKGNVLSESPPLITREDILNTGGTPPPEEWFNEDFSQQVPLDFDFEMDITTQESTDYRKLDAPNPVDEAQQNAQKQMEQAQQNTEKMLENLTKSDAEIGTEIEKQLVPDIPTEADFEKALRERFSVERFNRALSTLNQYGPKEGLRRLKESDPEIAEHIEKQRQR